MSTPPFDCFLSFRRPRSASACTGEPLSLFLAFRRQPGTRIFFNFGRKGMASSMCLRTAGCITMKHVSRNLARQPALRRELLLGPPPTAVRRLFASAVVPERHAAPQKAPTVAPVASGEAAAALAAAAAAAEGATKEGAATPNRRRIVERIAPLTIVRAPPPLLFLFCSAQNEN